MRRASQGIARLDRRYWGPRELYDRQRVYSWKRFDCCPCRRRPSHHRIPASPRPIASRDEWTRSARPPDPGSSIWKAPWWPRRNRQHPDTIHSQTGSTTHPVPHSARRQSSHPQSWFAWTWGTGPPFGAQDDPAAPPLQLERSWATQYPKSEKNMAGDGGWERPYRQSWWNRRLPTLRSREAPWRRGDHRHRTLSIQAPWWS